MYKGLIRYVGVGVILFVLWHLMLGYFPFLLCFLYIVLFIVSYILSRRSRQLSEVKVSCDRCIVERCEHVYLSFDVIDPSSFHCGSIHVEYDIIDAYQQLIEKRNVVIYDMKAIDLIELKHCGYYKIVIQSIKCFDLLQCIHMKRQYHFETSLYVFPFYQESSFQLQELSYASQDSYEYSPHQKGDDYSEMFDLRAYQETDSLRHIHWKASLKRNELFVKEGSLPITKRIILALDLKGPIDEAYDYFYSISLYFLKKQIPFEIVCFKQHDIIGFELIQNQEFFQECLQRLMRTPMMDLQQQLKNIGEHCVFYKINGYGIEVYQK